MTSFRISQPELEGEGPFFVAFEDGKMTADKWSTKWLGLLNGEFEYQGTTPTTGLPAKETPWHWYQFGLAMLGRGGDLRNFNAAPSIEGDTPEMPSSVEQLLDVLPSDDPTPEEIERYRAYLAGEDTGGRI